MNGKQALAFVEQHGVVLQAARGPVPSLAEAVAGGPIRGSWWGHPKGHEIFEVADAVSESGDVLVCRLVEGKVTYVHRRLWPALVKMASRFPERFPPDQLAKIWEEHTETGAHRACRKVFPAWVPEDVMREADQLSEAEAEQIFRPWMTMGGKPARKKPTSAKAAPTRPADKKAGRKEPAGKKPAREKPAREKPAGKKPATKKPATKKPATKKPATKKTSRQSA